MRDEKIQHRMQFDRNAISTEVIKDISHSIFKQSNLRKITINKTKTIRIS